jgi:hypothetical protein
MATIASTPLTGGGIDGFGELAARRRGFLFPAGGGRRFGRTNVGYLHGFPMFP